MRPEHVRDRVLAEAGLPPGFVFEAGLTVVNAQAEREALGVRPSDRVFESAEGRVEPLTRDEARQAVAAIDAVQPHVRERYRRGQW